MPLSKLVSCSELQCVAVCCSVLQCAAVCCSLLLLQCAALCCSVLQCVAMCCSHAHKYTEMPNPCAKHTELQVLSFVSALVAPHVYIYIYTHTCTFTIIADGQGMELEVWGGYGQEDR